MTIARPPEAPRAQEDAGSLITRIGTAAFTGAIAAALSAVPAVLRVGHAADTRLGAIGVWLALTACWVVPAVAAVVIFRGARDGLRAFGGPGAAARGAAALLWLFTLLAAFDVVGSVLRAKTHHHGLAGVTFALIALFFAIASALVAARVSVFLSSAPRGLQIAALVVASLLVCGALLAISVSLSRSDDGDSSVASAAIDLLALAIAAGFVSRAWLANRRVLAVLGPPIAATFLILGISTARASSDLPEIVRDRAPAFAPAVELVTGR